MTGQLICAFTGVALLYMALRASRTGQMRTIQGTLLRHRSPRLFGFLVVFWFAAAVVLLAAAVGVFGPIGR